MNASGDLAGLVIFGGGGHARVLVDALRAGADARAIAILDVRAELHGSLVLDARIVGADDALPLLRAAGATLFAIGVGGPHSGNTSLRRALFERACTQGLVPFTIVHPRAIVSAFATLEAGAQILAGAIVNAGSRIGRNSIVNSGAVVEHDCLIGDHVHIASAACLAGGVSVADGAHIGAGATVRQGLRIGERAVVAMGAAVISDVAADCVVGGVPAKALDSAVRGRATSR